MSIARNRSTLIVCFFVILGSWLLNCSVAGAGNSATMFIYHKFGENKYPTTNVSLERFEEQMQFLQENTYQVISLSDLVGLLANDRPLPEKTAVITIDDGYTSTYTGAWPILKKYRYPFTVFLYVKAVQSKYRNFLTWSQIKEMQDAGVDFQSHTYSHQRLGTWDKNLDEEGYRNWISTDIQKSYDILATQLGVAPLFLALPYGEYNSIIIEEARQIGFEAVFSQDPGSISASTDLFRIPREPILGNDWATMKHFKMVLERVDLPVNDLSPTIEPFTNTTPDNFCASVSDVDTYKKGSFGIYVSELGWQSATVAGRRVCIENTKSLSRRTNRVVVSAREKDTGLSAIHYWLLLNPNSLALAK